MQETPYFLTVNELLDLQKSDNNIIIIDVQFVLGDAKASEELFYHQHINNSIFANLETDLSGSIKENTGRHPLPNISDFVKFLENSAIHPNKWIIIYDNFSGGAAARLWWMLRSLGFSKISLLDGGIQEWIKQGAPITTRIDNPDPIEDLGLELPLNWEDGKMKLITKEKLLEDLPRKLFVLVDSRDEERFAALTSGPDAIPGRIPGAKNLPWKSNVNNKEKIKSQKELLNNFQNIIDQNLPVVYYCGSGVTACFNVLVSEILGISNVTLFTGSYSEWERNYPTKIEK